MARSVTIGSTRARISSIFAKSASSTARKRSSSDISATLRCRIMNSFLTMLVQASLTIRVGLPARGEQLEVLDAVTLPAILQIRRPVRVGRAVAAHVDRRRRALKHEQVAHRPAQVRHTLDCGHARTDDADSFVGELGQIAAGVVVVLPTGVECVPAEVHDPVDAGQFRLLQVSVGHRDIAGLDRVTVVGRHDPPGSWSSQRISATSVCRQASRYRS